MKKLYVLIIFILMMLFNTRTVHAATPAQETVIRDIVAQLASGNSVTVNYSGPDISCADVIEYAYLHADDPNYLYDGPMIEMRGGIRLITSPTQIQAVLINGYDIDDAETLTNSMVSEISEHLSGNASDREKMAAICSYVADTYSYDYDGMKLIEETKDNSYRTNFVDAYYGNRKIICCDYAALTYLLANKLGINCQIMRGMGHAYNIVKFSDSDHYIGYDLSSDSKYAQIRSQENFDSPLHHPETAMSDKSIPQKDKSAAQMAVVLNNGREYQRANRLDYLKELRYLLFD